VGPAVGEDATMAGMRDSTPMRSPGPSRRSRGRAVVAAGALASALAGALAIALWTAAPPAAGQGSVVRLTVTFVRDDGAPRHVARLRCTGTRASASGYLRDTGAQRACRHARRVARLLTSAPGERACTQIYGGPERARVTGTIGTRRVARAFSRVNGCEIADWTRAVPLLPRPTSG
jgi:hypothetical protein